MRSAIALALSLTALDAWAEERVVVAVADFDVQGAKDLAPLGKGMAQMLTTDLSVADSVRLVERARLREVLGEIALAKSPYFDPAGAAKLGKGIGAELIVTGQILGEGSALRLDVRAIDVESGEVLYAGKVQGTRERIFELAKELADAVIAGLGAKLTPIAKKQVGKRGAHSFAALASFGAAIDAEDRGAKEELARHLTAALKADPEFAAAKDRLSALEERVGTLERSGGLILAPSSWRDHLHNFKLHRQNADLVQAEKSLLAALALEPRRAELWTYFSDLPAPRRQAALKTARLDAASKRALVAHLAGDLGALRDAPESAENPAFRSVLVIDLIGRRLTVFTVTMAIELARASAYVLGPANRRQVEPMLVDEEAFFTLAKTLVHERLEGRDPPASVLEELVQSGPEGTTDGASSAWKLDLVFAERPSSPIEVKLSRVPFPAGEKQYPNDGLWDSKHSQPDDPKRAAAVRSGRAYGWYVNPGSDPFARGGIKGFAKFGDGFTIPKEDKLVECEANTKSPTNEVCFVLMTLQKLSVTPGPYAIEVKYRDAAGAEVRYVDPHLWIWEFKLAEFKTGLWMNMDPDFAINPIDDRLRERMGAEGKTAKMAALACANPPISDVKSPLASIHYDYDFGLRGGRAVARTDAAEWAKYRTQILERGSTATPHRDDGCAYAPLPQLEPGRHTLCLVAKRKDGSRTLEPECFTTEVPAHYPQEGRKPR